MIPMPEPREIESTTSEQPHHMPRLLSTRPLPAPLAPVEGESSLEPRRVFAALKYHWFLFIVLGSLLGAGLGAVAWELLPAKYTTTALLRVNSSNAGLLGADPQTARSEFITFLRTQADAIRSENVLRAALRDSKIGNTDTLNRVDDPVRYLQENILVDFSEHSELMKVSMTGENAAELAEVINAVNAAYMKEVVYKDQLKKTGLLDNLDRGRATVADKIKNLKMQLELKQKKPMGGAVPDLAIQDGQAGKPRVTQAEINRIADELSRADMNHKLAEQRLQALQARRDKIDAQQPTAQELDDYLSRDGEYRALLDKAERAAKQASLFRGSYASPTHPDVLEAQKKSDAARAAADEHSKSRRADLVRQMQTTNRRTLDNEVEKAAFDLASRDMLRKMLKQRLESMPAPKELERVITGTTVREKDPADYDMDVSSLIYAISTYEDLLKRQNQQSVEVQAAKPRVDEWQKAAVPIKKEMKKQVIFTAFAALLGFAAVGACITMYEGKVNRVFGSDDLAQNPALHVIGVLPEIGAGDTIGDAQRLKADPYMEGVEKVRLMLGRNFLGKRAQAILISSASAGEGKTTLAGHLAVSMTRADRKTIIVDANLRRPGLHEHLGLPAGPGVCDLLRGEGTTQEVVQRTAINNLWFLAAGAWDSAAQQALGRDRFRRVLDRLRQEYDYVIIDSHDLSTVADTFQIGQHCDAVIVCARKYVSRKAVVEQAYQRVCDLGVPHTGLIFLGESAKS